MRPHPQSCHYFDTQLFNPIRETSYLDVDHEGSLWDEVPEGCVREEHHESCERHEVGAIAGHHEGSYYLVHQT